MIYQDLGDLVRAVGHDSSAVDAFDTSCFSGEYVTGDVTGRYLRELELVRSDAAKSRRDQRVLSLEAHEGDEESSHLAVGSY